MGDEAKSIARGLQKRDPDLLDRLIEQYQYRLFRYLVYVTGNKEARRGLFPGDMDPRSRTRTSMMAGRNLKLGSSPSRGTS